MPMQIDLLRLRPCKRNNFRIAAYSHNLIAHNSKGLPNGKRMVDRHNLAVVINGIRKKYRFSILRPSY